jgi:hypothetical protein
VVGAALADLLAGERVPVPEKVHGRCPGPGFRTMRGLFIFRKE